MPRGKSDAVGWLVAAESFHAKIDRGGPHQPGHHWVPDNQPESVASSLMRLRARGEPGIYLEELRGVFGPARQGDHFDEALWPASTLLHLCGDALQAGIETAYVSALIAQRDLQPEGPDLLAWPWRFRVYTLGRFSLVQDGQVVTFAGKAPRKPLEMLQVLIALGGREVDVSLVMRELWPEDGSCDMRKLFDNTVHRLRLLLGHKDAVSLHNGKLTLDLKHCWVDAWAFDRLVGRICGGDLVAPEFLRDARQLYQGHFLQREAEQPWLMAYRDRLRSRFHRLVLVEGHLLESMGHWSAAARVYEEAIEVDNLTEILYRRLMLCHLAMGEFAATVGVYRRCRDLLSIVLGVKPSQETETIRMQVQGI